MICVHLVNCIFAVILPKYVKISENHPGVVTFLYVEYIAEFYSDDLFAFQIVTKKC
jgi:hypothetical protein